jgi:hypothetical protein
MFSSIATIPKSSAREPGTLRPSSNNTAKTLSGQNSIHHRSKTMIHHISIGARNISASKAFYDAALTPIGYTCLSADDASLGYGSGTHTQKRRILSQSSAGPWWSRQR